jgi:hypothetical protein
MARCSVCNSKLPFLKVGLLSKAYSGVACKTCNTYYEGSKSQLTFIGSVGAVGGVFMLNWTYKMFNSNYEFWYIGLICTVVYFIGFMYLQNRIITLKVAENLSLEQKPSRKEEVVHVPNKFEEPVEHLKYVYRNYSEKQLMEIITKNGYRKDAKQAALLLLKEKFGKEVEQQII